MSHKYILLLLILLSCCIPDIHCVEIYKDEEKDTELELSIEIAGQYSFDITNIDHIPQWDSGSIGFKGDIGKYFGFHISGDIADGVNDNNLWTGFNNLYIQVNLLKQLRFRVGQCKVPFGYDIFNGKDERPYFSHSLGSQNISPGKDRGLLIRGTNIIGKLDYGIGFFFGDGDMVPPSESNGLLVPLLLKTGFTISKDFRIDIGGNAALHKDDFSTGDFAVKDGIWFSLEYKPVKNQKLTFFTEYQEESLFNSDRLIADGKFSLFSGISYALFFTEPTITFELFDDSKRFYTDSDVIVFSAGSTFHVSKYGQLKLFYEHEAHYKTGEKEQALLCLVLFTF